MVLQKFAVKKFVCKFDITTPVFSQMQACEIFHKSPFATKIF